VFAAVLKENAVEMFEVEKLESERPCWENFVDWYSSFSPRAQARWVQPSMPARR
jgi:hypothetical protein